MILQKHIFIYLLVLLTISAKGQSTVHFKQITSEQGLSSNSVYAIIKDSRGFIWFGTSYGLNRYDGYGVKKYFNSSNKKSLPENDIKNLQEDGCGNLWIQTTNNFAIYNYQKDCFNCNVKTILSPIGINYSGNINFIYIDNNKDLWVYDGLRLFYYRFKEKQLHIYKQKRKGVLHTGRINAMRQVGNLFYLIHQSGLIECLAPIMNKVVSKSYYLCHFTNHTDPFYLYADNDDCLWVYSVFPSGAWMLNTKSGKWNHFYKEAKCCKLTSNVVHDVMQDNKGNIWIAMDHGGINILNKKTLTMTDLQNDPTNPSTLGCNTVYKLYADKEGIMWAGTFKRGISYSSPNTQKFSTLYLSDKNNPINLNDINAICEDKNGFIWFGTDGQGLVRMNRTTNEMTHFTADGSSRSLSGDIIVTLMCDSKGRIWIGTYLNGLCCYKNGQFKQYRHDIKNENSLAQNNIWSIKEDKSGIIWIGTLGNGLQSLNPETGRFSTFTKGLLSASITDLWFDNNNTLYVATSWGLNTMNTNTQKISHNIPENRWKNQNISCLYMDSRRLLWVGSDKGLSVYDEKRNRIKYVILSEDSQADVIKGIVEDDNKNMWVTTNKGLNNILVEMNPVSRNFKCSVSHYDANDGIQSTFFNGRSFCKTRDGVMFLGSDNGYNIIDPNDIPYNRFLPKVVFTKLKIYNNSVAVDSTVNGHVILKQSFDETKKLDLNYSVKMFSIEFSSLDYAMPNKGQYAYKLEGFNSSWIETKENKVSFTNLDPGTYILKVKAANSDNYWNNTPSTITIVIHPPLWRTNKAYFLYLMLIIGTLYYYYRRDRKKQERKLQTQRIEMEAKRQNEVNEMKLRFFTNISHDFRTPLSLIITPLEKLLDEQSGELKKNLEVIHQSAVQLLNLVNQLLDFRRLDVNEEKLNLSEGNLIDVLKNKCMTFQSYVEQKNIKLNFFSDIPEFNMAFDKDKVDKIMMNLLSNAFKFTPERGEIDVTVKIDDKLVAVEIKDNGINISDKDKEHIFERFYQVKQPKLNVGSGIGLHIVKEYVKLLGGSITITDNQPSGAIFIFTLPVRKMSNEESDKDEYFPTESTVKEKEERPTILVVEDNETFRNFVVDCLKEDYQTLSASDGREALQLLDKNEVSIILSDVMMPVMDGLELCKQVKTNVNFSHIPIILLTARTAEEHKMLGLEYGADDYITKPFNLKMLKLRINKFLEWNHWAHINFSHKIDINPSEITISSLDEKLMQKAIKKVEENMNNTELSVEELSTEVGMSRGHLYKKLMNITGKSPIEFIRIIRLKRSLQYLKESQMSISEIAYEVGFGSPKIYTKYFKDEYKITPSEYIKKQNTPLQD
jgi:signal transduction histidine kinase/ligand-binding sensor domain-containing protein/DNA-binding response OmpR family regulator